MIASRSGGVSQSRTSFYGNSNPAVGFCQEMQYFLYIHTQAAAIKPSSEAFTLLHRALITVPTNNNIVYFIRTKVFINLP